MRAVWLEVPEELLEERRRLGHDKRDELALVDGPRLRLRDGEAQIDM